MTIKELLSGERLDAAELMDWWREYQERPWGFAMENLRFGTVATAVLQPWGKSHQIPRPGDWFSRSAKPRGQWTQSEESMKAHLSSFLSK